MNQEQIAQNDQAIRRYMAKNFPDEAGVEEYVAAVKVSKGGDRKRRGGGQGRL